MLTPVQDRIVVDPNAAESVTPGGLILPPNAQNKPEQGTVVAVGPGAPDVHGVFHEVPLEPGDEIIYSKYGGTPVSHEGKDYLLLTWRDVLCKVT